MSYIADVAEKATGVTLHVTRTQPLTRRPQFRGAERGLIRTRTRGRGILARTSNVPPENLRATIYQPVNVHIFGGDLQQLLKEVTGRVVVVQPNRANPGAGVRPGRTAPPALQPVRVVLPRSAGSTPTTPTPPSSTPSPTVSPILPGSPIVFTTAEIVRPLANDCPNTDIGPAVSESTTKDATTIADTTIADAVVADSSTPDVPATHQPTNSEPTTDEGTRRPADDPTETAARTRASAPEVLPTVPPTVPTNEATFDAIAEAGRELAELLRTTDDDAAETILDFSGGPLDIDTPELLSPASGHPPNGYVSLPMDLDDLFPEGWRDDL